MPPDRDDRLLGELGEAVRDAAGLPPSFLAAGRAAYGWRDLDAELAALTGDSDAAVAAGMRSDRAVLRSLTFTGRDVTIEVQVRPDALVGQLVPPAPGELDVRTAAGEVRTVEVDEVGWFAVEPPPTGLVSLYVRTAGVVTEWTSL